MKKLSILLLGVLSLAAVASAFFSSSEEVSLSEDLANSRLARSPLAEAKRRKKGKKAGRKSSRRGGKKRKGRKSKSARRKPKSARRKPKSGRRKPKSARRKPKKGTRMNEDEDEDEDSICFEKSITIMRMWKDVISNFEKQMKRMGKQNTTGISKAGKAAIFAPVAKKLTETGGGNKSALSCGGNTTNAGAKQLKNLTDVLSACEADVKKMCGNFTKPNMTKLAECKVLAEEFKKGAQMCLDKSVGSNSNDMDTACDCWTDDTLDKTVQAAKSCKFPTEAKTIADELKNCTKTFGKCRKYEDAAISTLSHCSTNAELATRKVSLVSNV